MNADQLPNATPEAISIEFLSLSRYYPLINAFSSFVGWAIILVVLFLSDFLVAKVDLHWIVLPLVGLFSIFSAIYGYVFARSCGYFQGEFEVFYKDGLWWKKQTALSFSRIQHIDISHGPLERKYEMATIKFFTAGGAASDLKIPGLPKQLAESLRMEILQQAKIENELSDFSKSDQHKSNQAESDKATPSEQPTASHATGKSDE